MIHIVIRKNKTHYDVIIKYCTVQILIAKINLPTEQTKKLYDVLMSMVVLH